MSALKRQRQAVLAVALVVIGSPLLATGPASAVSATLSYDCTSSPNIGQHVFTAVIDTDAPATLGVGLSTPIKTTSTVTIPDAVADQLRLATVSYVSGSASATGTVNGVNRETTLTIPNSTVPPDGTAMQVVGTGPSGSITAGAAGSTILLGAGKLTATVQGYNSVATPVGPPYTFTCALQASQNLLVDTVNVVPAPTTTTITVQAPVEYGAEPAVTVAVAAPGTKAKPAGMIEFTFEGKTVKVEVKAGKAKATLPQALTMGVRPVTAKFTPTDKNLAVNETTKNVTVVRDQTTTTASAIYRDARNRLVGKGKVVAQHGTAVTGKVKFVLKRDGVKIRTALIGVNKFGGAKKVFKNVSKAGKYTVVARYLGSPSLKRSVDRAKLVV